jgi:hypothetical protein
LLNAEIIPRLRENCRVIECRIADDPFGKLRSALLDKHYQRAEQVITEDGLREVLIAASQSQNQKALDRSNVNPSFIICIDQFEELFVTVRENVRRQFLAVLKEAIDDGACRLILGIRSEFFGLLLRLCHAVDSQQQTLVMTSFHTLKAFNKPQALRVLRAILQPLNNADDPLLKQQLESFARALVANLLRPPRDTNLYRDDPKTVLPAEMQTVGMTLEEIGIENFSVDGLRRMGGIAGLLKRYIEQAKENVYRATLVQPDNALLILRQLISPAQTKIARTARAIKRPRGVSVEQVERVLDAFADQFLVNRLPEETGNGKASDKPPSYRYELMHEHLVQVLREAPDPLLQKARDAEKRLLFWQELTNAVFQANESAKSGSFFNRLKQLLEQPIPFIESLHLWGFARSDDERRMLRRNLRGFGFKMMVALLILAVLWIPWEFWWTRTDAYQIRSIISEAPIAQAVSGWRESEIQERFLGFKGLNIQQILIRWSETLAYENKFNDVLSTAREIKNVNNQARALTAITDGLDKGGKMDEALSIAREIKNDGSRARALAAIADSQMKANNIDAARSVLTEALSIAREIKYDASPLPSVP